MGNTVDVVRNMKRPRFARSHLPWHLLPKDLTTSKAKVTANPATTTSIKFLIKNLAFL